MNFGGNVCLEKRQEIPASESVNRGGDAPITVWSGTLQPLFHEFRSHTPHGTKLELSQVFLGSLKHADYSEMKKICKRFFILGTLGPALPDVGLLIFDFAIFGLRQLLTVAMECTASHEFPH